MSLLNVNGVMSYCRNTDIIFSKIRLYSKIRFYCYQESHNPDNILGSIYSFTGSVHEAEVQTI